MFSLGRIKADPPPFVLLDELENLPEPSLCLGLGERFDFFGGLLVFIGHFRHTCQISQHDGRLSGELPNRRLIFRPHGLSEFLSRLSLGLLSRLIQRGLLGVRKLKTQHNERATAEKRTSVH
jgi:hypothetical protein